MDNQKQRDQKQMNHKEENQNMENQKKGNQKGNQTEELNARKVMLAAEMYYLYDMSQKEISDRLGVSRPWVSRLLKRARETGIVSIRISSPLAGSPEIEEAIRDRYGIRAVTVVPNVSENDHSNVSMAAASYLVSHIQAGDRIGVSWGQSIAEMTTYVSGVHLPGVSIVPVVGGAGSEVSILSNTNAANLAGALGASCSLLHAEACCADEQEREIVLSNSRVREIIDQGEHADIALLGIGGMDHSRIIGGGYVTAEEVEEMRARGIAGDVAFRFLQPDGRIADVSFNRRVVACDLHRIRENAREVIAIAYGREKAQIIRAALRGGLITTLFTDEETARLLD